MYKVTLGILNWRMDIHRLSSLGTPIPPIPHPYRWHNQVHIHLAALSF